MQPSVRLKDRKENKNQAISETPTYHETDLGQLLKRAASGDFEAFGEIYTMYLDRIYRYVFYQVKDKMVAEDLTEEIFVKAWTAIKAYKGERLSFSTWLYRIAHNHIIDHFRTAQPHISLDGEALGYAKILGNIADPEQDVENRLTQQEVLELVSCLRPAQRQIIILKFIEGLDNREIEQITNKRQGAIRVMQMRALATLRRRLSNELR
jgi:RNA polymerase sigma-70 factor, ECF subfamily